MTVKSDGERLLLSVAKAEELLRKFAPGHPRAHLAELWRDHLQAVLDYVGATDSSEPVGNHIDAHAKYVGACKELALRVKLWRLGDVEFDGGIHEVLSDEWWQFFGFPPPSQAVVVA